MTTWLWNYLSASVPHGCGIAKDGALSLMPAPRAASGSTMYYKKFRRSCWQPCRSDGCYYAVQDAKISTMSIRTGQRIIIPRMSRNEVLDHENKWFYRWSYRIWQEGNAGRTQAPKLAEKRECLCKWDWWCFDFWRVWWGNPCWAYGCTGSIRKNQRDH